MTSSAVKNNFLPPALVSNLEQVLLTRKGTEEVDEDEKQSENHKDEFTKEPSSSPSDCTESSFNNSESLELKPLVLVTNGDGIESSGLKYLVEALVREDLYNVHVCAPQSDKSLSGHSLTMGATVAVNSAEINGVTAYEVSGTPADCVSLALSGALFSWSKPLLVISGINRGSSCGHQMFSSGVVAGAREALISGVPSISISLSWKKDESQDTDFKDAVSVCLPMINAVVRDIGKDVFPKDCSLKIEVPLSPLKSKGFKATRQSLWRFTRCWQAISASRQPSAARFMSNQQSLGMQLAQLSRDASAAGAARRLTTQKKNVEVESIGVSGKSEFNRSVKYFRLEFVDKDQEDVNEGLDFRALEKGYVAVTPISLTPDTPGDTQTTAILNWISSALQPEQ